MADKQLNIKVSTNIAELFEQQKKLSAEMIRLTTNLDKLGVAGENALKKIEQQSSRVSSEMEKIDRSGEQLIRTFIPFGNILTTNFDKINKLADAFKNVEKAGGFAQYFQTYLGRMNEGLKTVQNGMEGAFGKGLQSMLSIGRAGLAGLIPILKTLSLLLLKFLPVIAVVGFAIFTLQRMWMNNIGGMQTYFHRFVATLRQVWNRFVVNFDRMLRALSPVFKILFSSIFTLLIGAVEILAGLLEGIMDIVKPIIEVFAEWGEMVGEILAEMGSGGGEAIDIFKEIGALLKFIGQIIGFVIRVALIPMRLQMRAISFAFKEMSGFIKPLIDLLLWLFDVTPLGMFINSLGAINESLAELHKLIDGISKLPGIDLLFGKPEARVAPAAMAATGGPTMASQVMYNQQKTTTINNNQSIAVHSAGAITAESAPHIADVISKMLGSQAKVL